MDRRDAALLVVPIRLMALGQASIILTTRMIWLSNHRSWLGKRVLLAAICEALVSTESTSTLWILEIRFSIRGNGYLFRRLGQYLNELAMS